ALVARAFAVRDRVWADLPYLAEWATSGDDKWATDAEQLSESTFAVADWLSEASKSAADLARLRTALARAEKSEERLRGNYEEELRSRLEKKEQHLGELVALEGLLAAPLSGPERRIELWKRYLSILSQQQAGGDATSASLVLANESSEQNAKRIMAALAAA